MPISRTMTTIGLFLLVLFGGFGIWYLTQEQTYTTAPPSMITHDGEALRIQPGSSLQNRLIVSSISETNEPHQVTVPAQIIPEPGHNVNIYAPVAGRVASIHVQTGQTVQKGDILATLYSGDLAQAWSDERKAQATLTLTRNAYKRATAVLTAGGNAVKDMQSARNDLEQAEAEANRAQQRLTALGTTGAEGYQPLIAPFSGVVSNITLGVGQNITDTTSVLMTVLDTSNVWVSASIPENLIPLLQANMTLTAPFIGQTCEGPITAQDPALHTDTRRLNIYLRCNNPQNALHSGQFTTATLNIPERSQILLPKTALLMNNDEVSVFIESAPNTYRRRMISVSYDEGDTVRVISGISSGERVVTHGAILLNDN